MYYLICKNNLYNRKEIKIKVKKNKAISSFVT